VSGFTDKNSVTDMADVPVAPAGQLQSPDRRHFSRNVLAGSAVLLSLGNRSAWGGGGGGTLGCMSVTTLNSFNPATGMFVSAPAGRKEHNVDLAKEIHRISNPPDYLGTDGRDSTCQDPKSLDGICLVRGRCPRG
jgi:hypothetical protein